MLFQSLTITPVLLCSLAVWRVTHLVSYEDGPFDMFRRFRSVFGRSVIGQLLGCFYCLSIWVSIPFALLLSSNWTERAILWLALSGAAILMERAVMEKSAPVPLPAVWREEPPVSLENEPVALNAASESNAGKESEEHVLLRR